jgi:hypothetical protein
MRSAFSVRAPRSPPVVVGSDRREPFQQWFLPLVDLRAS